MNLNHVHFKQYENLSQLKPFTSGQIFNTFHNVVAKSTTERGNSNNKTLANISTPFNNRAFFVRKLNTPKENNQRKISPVILLSMVAFSGQRLIVGCVPKFAVFHPAKRYRQTVGSKAIAFKNLTLELSAMLTYLLKAISRRDLNNTRKPINQMTVYTLKTQAESEEQARALFAPYYVILNVKGGVKC